MIIHSQIQIVVLIHKKTVGRIDHGYCGMKDSVSVENEYGIISRHVNSVIRPDRNSEDRLQFDAYSTDLCVVNKSGATFFKVLNIVFERIPLAPC